MSFLNIEIKAICHDPVFIRNYLLSNGAEFRGLDEQTDTYFNVQRGRLKLREGIIENNLIYYERADQPGPKDSHFSLVGTEDAKGLKQILTQALGVKVVVRKKREIYYIDNVKFHLDEVPGLGLFVEIEAANMPTGLPPGKLKEQCAYYQKELGIKEEQLVELSYSDLLTKLLI